MKKTITKIWIMVFSFITFYASSQGFSPSPINWSTPVGGLYGASGNAGYYSLYNWSFPNYNNSQNWNYMDMNGDDKVDLVITCEYQSANGGAKQYGAGTSPYWKVYLNNGVGFSGSPANWYTPIGGYYSNTGVNYGYITLSDATGASNNNSQIWNCFDINGDNKPDLVVTCAYLTSTGNSKQYGAGTSPYWKVYLNTGTGFSTTAINWSTPIGGYYSSTGVNYGYQTLASGALLTNNNSQNWNCADINGDNKIDLIVTSEYQSANGGIKQYGAGTSPYWKVYLNTGTGFSSSTTNFTSPVGGTYSSTGVNSGYYIFSNNTVPSTNNSQMWSCRDMNGDHKLDLVIPTVYQGTGAKQFGAGTSNPYWKVYLNTGTGFSSTATTWNTPIGGFYTSAGATDGYYDLDIATASYANSQIWNTIDINGDYKPDLVIESEYQNGIAQYGAGTSPYWRVYMNTGTGFSGSSINWSSPIGGFYASSGANAGYYTLTGLSASYNNSQNWNIIDINGDNKLDLVISSEYQSANGGTKQYGVGTSPYCKVYLNTSTVGFNELGSLSQSFEMYPNPTASKISVITKELDQTIIVYNTLGNTIYMGKVENKITEIDLQGQASGIYFIQIGTISKKIVKQ